jgi:hypothetical protein
LPSRNRRYTVGLPDGFEVNFSDAFAEDKFKLSFRLSGAGKNNVSRRAAGM